MIERAGERLTLRSALTFAPAVRIREAGRRERHGEGLAVGGGVARAACVGLVVERVEDYGVEVREVGRWPTCADVRSIPPRPADCTHRHWAGLRRSC